MTMWRWIWVSVLFLPTLAAAQGLQIGFRGLDPDSDDPIEIAADSMTVNNETGDAQLQGNVVVVQGDMRMQANTIDIVYTQDGGVSEMIANGSVLLVTTEEEVEAQRAIYNVDAETMLLIGDVLMVQGRNAISAEQMDIDLQQETAVLSGRVRTILYSNDDTTEATE